MIAGVLVVQSALPPESSATEATRRFAMNPVSNEETLLPIPNGWFAVAYSRDLGEGDVQRIDYFDTHLVLFRTRSGEARVLDAFCPHLGAHLGEGGKVIGETIRCPFHHWQFDGDGQCLKIPYSETGKIPQRAKLRSWPVCERNHLIFVWHHAEGKPPEWEVPEIAEFHEPSWTDPRRFTVEVPIHMQEMAENNCDPVHFHYVHSADTIPVSKNTYAEDGRYYKAVSSNERETPLGRFQVDLVRETWGMGLSSVRLEGVPGAGLYLFSSTSPITRKHTISRWLLTVSRNLVDVMGDEFMDQITGGLDDDIRIWENKIHRPDPVLCDADTFLAEFRQWAKQFYSTPEHQPEAR